MKCFVNKKSSLKEYKYERTNLDKSHLSFKKTIQNRPQVINSKALKHITNNNLDDKDSKNDKWMKVICTAIGDECVKDLINEMEGFILKYTNVNVSLTTINLVLNDEKSEFYLKLKDSEYKILCKFQHQIKSCDVTFSSNRAVYISDMPDSWISAIKTVLVRRFRINEGTKETELDLSNFSSDQIFADKGLFLALNYSKVADTIVTILTSELSELSKLNISHNNLTNVMFLNPLVQKMKVTHIDIRNNELKRANVLNCLENNSQVVDLNVLGNEFVKVMKHSDLENKMKEIFPMLQTLNGTKLKQTIQIAGTTLQLPEVIPSSPDTEEYRFAIEFFTKFDSHDRKSLSATYSTNSILTMASADSLPFFYKSNSLNYCLLKNPEKRLNKIKRGKEEIMQTCVNFPHTKHLQESINVDVLTSVESLKILMLSGLYLELPYSKNKPFFLRNFSRTMTITPEGIIQEFISITAVDSTHLAHNKYKTEIAKIKNEWEFRLSHRELKNLTSADLEIVKKFKDLSSKSVKDCLEYLSRFNNIQEAMSNFDYENKKEFT
jgi:hypothetical protein